MMIRVLLWDLEGTVMIVKKKTGILYANQVQGHACRQEEQEGYLAPVACNLYGFAYQKDIDGFTSDLADELDKYFKKWALPWIVDRDMLPHSFEAWVHIIVTASRNLPFSTISPEPNYPYKAVLTWENSD